MCVPPRSTTARRAHSFTIRKGASSSAPVPSCASTSGRTRSTGATLAAPTESSSDSADVRRAGLRLLSGVDDKMGVMLAERKPEWLRVRPPAGENYGRLKSLFRSLDLHTVCEEAHCPNVWACWGGGTATLMRMWATCTRGCRCCAVTSGIPHGALDLDVPRNVARALAEVHACYGGQTCGC